MNVSIEATDAQTGKLMMIGDREEGENNKKKFKTIDLCDPIASARCSLRRAAKSGVETWLAERRGASVRTRKVARKAAGSDLLCHCLLKPTEAPVPLSTETKTCIFTIGERSTPQDDLSNRYSRSPCSADWPCSLASYLARRPGSSGAATAPTGCGRRTTTRSYACATTT